MSCVMGMSQVATILIRLVLVPCSCVDCASSIVTTAKGKSAESCM